MKVANIPVVIRENFTNPKVIGALAGVFVVTVLVVARFGGSGGSDADDTAKKTDSYFSQFRQALVIAWNSLFGGEKPLKKIKKQQDPPAQPVATDKDPANIVGGELDPAGIGNEIETSTDGVNTSDAKGKLAGEMDVLPSVDEDSTSDSEVEEEAGEPLALQLYNLKSALKQAQVRGKQG